MKRAATLAAVLGLVALMLGVAWLGRQQELSNRSLGAGLLVEPQPTAKLSTPTPFSWERSVGPAPSFADGEWVDFALAAVVLLVVVRVFWWFDDRREPNA